MPAVEAAPEGIAIVAVSTSCEDARGTGGESESPGSQDSGQPSVFVEPLTVASVFKFKCLNPLFSVSLVNVYFKDL